MSLRRWFAFAAVDPTIFCHDGRWWLFCSNHDDEDENKLFLWHAPALLGLGNRIFATQ
jgi:hypothetical protein